MSKRAKLRELTPSYVLGIIDATVSMWEEVNQSVPDDLELQWFVTESSNALRIQAIWRNGVKDDVNNENEWSDTWLMVYSKESIDSLVSDISGLIEEIIK